ncbi:myb-like DNA-binding domain containing protein [Histomonas meleagridis]|uniref:myb-like DNA-binding domain containing protein n=1 Tax=Histomonas meleagridis TaxID=135588 RepID=UPI00355A6703|nr:myb-like DNA-binding domain containing protein [Histomonas meleagridis]KAH0797398.1 myb-like DNA-binding domain containing protein [Histomonas meleagridis]
MERDPNQTESCANNVPQPTGTIVMRNNWTPNETKRLKDAVQIFGTIWDKVAQYVGSRTPKQCYEHWEQVCKPGINNGEWTPEEDRILFEMFLYYPRQWKKIATFLPGRTNQAVRNRYDKSTSSANRRIKNAMDQNHPNTAPDMPIFVMQPTIRPINLTFDHNQPQLSYFDENFQENEEEYNYNLFDHNNDEDW